MTEYDVELARALDEALPRQPSAGDWARVLDAAAGGRWWTRRHHQRLMVAIVVVAIVVLVPLTALAVSNDWWFLGSSSLAPPPVGKVIVVGEGNANGVPWAMTAYRSATQGLCVGFTPNPPDNRPAALTQGSDSAGLSCGSHVRGMPDVPPAEAHSFSFFGSFARPANPKGFPDFVAGTTADDVAQVRVVRANGETITVDTFAAPSELGMPLRFFVALVPAGSRVHDLVAVNANGDTVDRAVLGLPPTLTTQLPGKGKQQSGGVDWSWGS